jgi:hypothetical protein
MPTVGTCPNCMADLVGRHQRDCLTCGAEIPLEVRLIEIPVEPVAAAPEPQVDEPAPVTTDPEPAPIDAEPEPEHAPVRDIEWDDEDPDAPAAPRKRRFFRR